MHRLIYVSRSITRFPPDLKAILESSRRNNARFEITGALCFLDGVYCQYLEGDKIALEDLYQILLADPRHKDVVILSYEEISERKFPGWSMGLVNLDRINSSLLLKYSDGAALDPYCVSGKASLALFDELMATASIMGQSSPTLSAAR